jgi:hypothetical protein
MPLPAKCLVAAAATGNADTIVPGDSGFMASSVGLRPGWLRHQDRGRLLKRDRRLRQSVV